MTHGNCTSMHRGGLKMNAFLYAFCTRLTCCNKQHIGFRGPIRSYCSQRSNFKTRILHSGSIPLQPRRQISALLYKQPTVSSYKAACRRKQHRRRHYNINNQLANTKVARKLDSAQGPAGVNKDASIHNQLYVKRYE